MAIVYPLTMPTDPAPKTASLYIKKMQTGDRGYAGFLQVQDHPGERWIGKIELPLLSPNQSADWLGFFDALDGLNGTFLLPHPDFKTMRGSAGGSTGRVNGVDQRGTTVETDGWPANATFKRGDILQFGTGPKARMKRLTQDTQANSSGVATLDLRPEFIEAPDNNAEIRTTNCEGVFRLAESDLVPHSDPMSYHVVSFPVEEALK